MVADSSDRRCSAESSRQASMPCTWTHRGILRTLAMTAARGAMNKWPQKTKSIGWYVIAAHSAASAYAGLFSTGRSCRIPVGKVLTDLARRRGRTMTSRTPSHLVSADKKSRLYCAMPPSPANASVTSARMRNPDLAITLPLRPPIPGKPSAVPTRTYQPRAQESAAIPGCDRPAATTSGRGLQSPS